MVASSNGNSVVLNVGNSVFSTTALSIDGSTVAPKLTGDNFFTNYEKKLIKRNHL